MEAINRPPYLTASNELAVSYKPVTLWLFKQKTGVFSLDTPAHQAWTGAAVMTEHWSCPSTSPASTQSSAPEPAVSSTEFTWKLLQASLVGYFYIIFMGAQPRSQDPITLRLVSSCLHQLSGNLLCAPGSQERGILL